MDVSTYMEGIEAPELTLPRRGLARLLGPTKTYRGRILSFTEWLPFEPRIADVLKRQQAGEDVTRLLHDVFGDYLDAIGIPKRVVFGIPTYALIMVMKDFMALQGRAALGPPVGR